MNRQGFSLLELLVTLAILTLVGLLLGPSLRGWQDSSRVRASAAGVASLIDEAKAHVRKTDSTAYLAVDPTNRVVRIEQPKGTVIASRDLHSIIIDLNDQGAGNISSCGSLKCLEIRAPYATFQTNPARVILTSGETSVGVYVIGLTGKVVVR